MMKFNKLLLALLLVFFVAGCSINIGTKEEPKLEPATEKKEVNEIDDDDDAVVNESDAKISMDKAKEIALDHAKLKKADVTLVEGKLERDDGILQYDIEYRQGNISHEFEINADTGAVISYDMDND